MLRVHMNEEIQQERLLIAKQRGILKRIIDSNARVLAMGYNKLIEEWKAHRNELRKKLQFVCQSLSDKDARFVLQAYNGLMERKRMLDGIGMTNAMQNRSKLCRRMLNKGYD